MIPIVLLHGLWSRGPEEQLLSTRLRRYTGRSVERFGYHSMTRRFDDNVRALLDDLRRRRERPVDLVGHSLGGLVVLAALRSGPDVPVRRAVLLGPPVGGSVSARRLRRFGPVGRLILGRCGDVLVSGDPHPAPEGFEIGVIAGSRPFGMGRVLGPMDGASDGTVRLDETRLPGASARVVLPVSHTGMLFSDKVARAAACFLDTGRFEAPE